MTRDVPLPNGNTNGVGVILRSREDNMLWAAMRPMHDQSNLQATLWGIHVGLVKTVLLKQDKTHIETDNNTSFEIITIQDEIYIRQPLREVMYMCKTLHHNHF